MVNEFFFKQIHHNFLFHLSVWCVTNLWHFLSVVVSQLSNLRIIMKNIDMGRCGERIFSSNLIDMVLVHWSVWYVTILWHFFLRCCVKITEFGCYNKIIAVRSLWWTTFLQPSCGIIQWVPKDFFADYVSMKYHLLDGMLRFLKHAPPLEIFGPKLWVF